MEHGPLIEIVAAVIRDPAGRVLLVRKRGTRSFMQPGGKREPGEADLAVLSRELQEELACRIVPGTAVRVGEFEAVAANEPGQRVRAQVYEVAVAGAVAPQAEIEEIAWVDPERPEDIVLAPLTRDEILPRIGGAALPSS
jgi:8-oxo-dGTP diphosphatase